MPPSDRFLAEAPTEPGEHLAPLELAFCEECGLLQILETLDPRHLFGEEYVYLSSCSDSWLAHCERNALSLISRLELDAGSLVLETASNDGYLLQYFKREGIPVLGVEPAPLPACRAMDRGIPTISEFFCGELALRLRAQRPATLVVSNNVLAHVADLHDFIDGVCTVLDPNGTWVIEVPYVRDLVKGCAFDTVYHEHLCYFSLTALWRMLVNHGLFLNDVERLPSHGGSLRVYASSHQDTAHRVTQLLREEQAAGMLGAGYYLAFAERARATARRIADMLVELGSAGHRIAAYGAAAKGTILLNSLGDAARHIEFVVDRNPLKVDKRMPGVNIPILDPAEIRQRRPDYLLLLPWNLRAEVLQQQRDFLKSGGRFIVPLPEPEIVAWSER